jgi:hypothetical protein
MGHFYGAYMGHMRLLHAKSITWGIYGACEHALTSCNGNTSLYIKKVLLLFHDKNRLCVIFSPLLSNRLCLINDYGNIKKMA